MPKTKISEFSATPANNTDIDSINIAEGCAPSGINDAIRELMAQLKDFQTGAVGDSFNGPVGTTTAAAGAFTTLAASSTLGVTGVSTLTGGAVVQGLTVGRGAGAVSTNTAVGASALVTNTTGAENVAVGNRAVESNLTGTDITAVGFRAARLTTVGNITAFGAYALDANTTGGSNTAVGVSALQSNTTASNNTAVGYQAAYSNTTGVLEAFGSSALYSNTTGLYNKAFGESALYSNTTGSSNCAFGGSALRSVITGNSNTAVGESSLRNATGSGNTAIGSNSGDQITSGSKNTILGAYNGNQNGLDIRTASNHIVLSDGDGNPRAYWNSLGSMRVPYTYTDTTASAANVFVASDGQFLRSTSALKYKQDIRNLEEMDISLLRPVRYKSKCEGDDQTKDHLGVIADEAADAGFEELITRGATGEVEGFQYERLTVVLLKELQTLRARVAQLESN